MQDYVYALQYLNHVCHEIECSLGFYHDVNFYYRRCHHHHHHHSIRSTNVNVLFLCIYRPPVAKEEKTKQKNRIINKMNEYILIFTICDAHSCTSTSFLIYSAKLNIMILPLCIMHSFVLPFGKQFNLPKKVIIKYTMEPVCDMSSEFSSGTLTYGKMPFTHSHT